MHGHKYTGLFNLIPYWTFGLIQFFAITNSIINGLDHISLLTFGSLYDKFLQDELEVGPPVSVTPADNHIDQRTAQLSPSSISEPQNHEPNNCECVSR